MTGKRIVLFAAAISAALALPGCREGVDYEYAVNNDFVQLGCAGHLSSGAESAKAPPASGSLFRLGLPWWFGTERPNYGLALSLLADADDYGRGVAVAPVLAREHMTGAALAFLFGADEMRGVSVAYLNFVTGRGDLQIGVLNVAEFLYDAGYVACQLGVFNAGGEGGAAVQISPFVNQSNEKNRFQLGVLNFVFGEGETHRRCQIGMVNVAPGGFQLGLLNVNGGAALLKVFPLVNF